MRGRGQPGLQHNVDYQKLGMKDVEDQQFMLGTKLVVEMEGNATFRPGGEPLAEAMNNVDVLPPNNNAPPKNEFSEEYDKDGNRVMTYAEWCGREVWDESR